jgi:hypothetical protein
MPYRKKFSFRTKNQKKKLHASFMWLIFISSIYPLLPQIVVMLFKSNMYLPPLNGDWDRIMKLDAKPATVSLSNSPTTFEELLPHQPNNS